MKGTQRGRDRTKAQKEGGERREIPLSFWEVLPSFNPEDGAAFSFLAFGWDCCHFLPLRVLLFSSSPPFGWCGVPLSLVLLVERLFFFFE